MPSVSKFHRFATDASFTNRAVTYAAIVSSAYCTGTLPIKVHPKRLAKDLLHPSPIEEKRKHKLKRLVQHPNSYFMDVKCPGCYKITTVFSHAQSVVVCAGCSTILCQPTGGRARLTEGLYFT
uniref:40S ribosomal protein S27 n=2 Tax=Timema TaxID=61471 RepID=A0A7R9F0P8_9NEOP|nr:unnamed protein product [Timema bartmani]